MNSSSDILQLTGRQRLFLLSLLVAVIAVLLALWTSNDLLKTSMVGIIVVLLFVVAQPVWHPADYGRTRIRIYSLAIIATTALSYGTWHEIVVTIAQPYFEQFGLVLPQNSIPVAVMVFVLAGVLIVNYLMRDTSTMREHPSVLDVSESEGLLRLARVLRNELGRQDMESHWSTEFFEPVDAEVEVRRRGNIVRRTSSLLEAITNERKASTLLVLGDPGSGKSVALRKLASDLVEEVQKTGRLPLYVNLRDWRPNRPWTPDDPPTPQDFETFLLSHISGRDVFADQYLNERIGNQQRFFHLLTNQRIFLILDSFDEIPQLLDQSEATWLIDMLSDIIYNYISGGYNNRGILASRYFRRPSLKYRADAVFDIRPFSDEQLANSLDRRSSYSHSQVLALFTERPHLIPALRNPFIGGLVPGFSKINPDQLPDTELDLFETYLQERLRESIDGMRSVKGAAQLDVSSLEVATTDIAVTMVSKFGLEAPLIELVEAVGSHTKTTANTAEVAARALRYGRVARIGPGIDASFSFVHRRFAEFFLAKHLQGAHEELPLHDIPNDGRWREALALYTGVAPREEAEKISRYCMEYACRLPNFSHEPTSSDFLAGVHALRFLSASFRARREFLEPHDSELVDLVQRLLQPKTHTLAAKIGAEAIGLLPKATLSKLVPEALALGSDWIGQTAIRSCRHLANLGQEVVESICKYVILLQQNDFWRRHRELTFSFSLTEGLASAARTVRFRYIDSLIAIGAPIPLLFIDARTTIITAILFLLVFLFGKIYFLLISEAIKWAKKKADTKGVKMNAKVKATNRNFRHWMRNHIPHWLYPSPGVVELRKRIRRQAIYLQGLSSVFNWGGTAQYLLWRIFLFGGGAVILLRNNSLFWFFFQVPLPVELLYAGSIIGMMLAFPWFHSWLAIRYLVKNPHLVIYAVLYILSYIVVIYLIDIADELPGSHYAGSLLVGVNIVLLIVFSIFFLFIALRLILVSLRDKARCKNVKMDRTWTRSQIAEQLIEFESNKGRLKFLSMLDSHRVTPEGTWPEAGIPKLDNVQIDTMLAQLEERWLGLSG